MTARERAKRYLKEQCLQHIIYGYRANSQTIESDWETEMLKFTDDDSFVEYVDKMQAEIDGLDMVLAVHA